MRTLFTSESVTEGHPDKICDQISDGILDALLAIDPNSRCACETTAEPGAVHIMGEITTAATVNYIEIARQIIREIGYTKPEYGFDADTCEYQLLAAHPVGGYRPGGRHGAGGQGSH